MSAAATHAVPRLPARADSRSTLLALARADAVRYARHPLFLLPSAVLLVAALADAVQQKGGGTDPLTGTLLIAFLLGVFGFVVAHRLTTSLVRTRDIAETVPVDRQLRTLALCLACLVPAAAGALMAAYMVLSNALWPPDGDPSRLPVTWFSDYPAVDVLAALIAMGPVAALGGPLLGVAVARWAPFRGSALLGVVILVVWTVFPASSETGGHARLISAWPVLYNENVVHGKIISTTFVTEIEPVWALGWVLCLCGLAVVAALLREPAHRRPLLITGAMLTAAAAACFVLAQS
jgi:hypothetical protein